MHPVLFLLRIGIYDIEILAYSFFYILAVVIVIVGGWWYVRKSGFTHREISVMILIMTFSGFVGARFMHALTNSALYISGKVDLFACDMTHFSITGGIIGSVFSGLLVGKLLRIDLWVFADRLMPFLGIGIAVARIGCFLNGCCFGHMTTMPWGVRFPLFSQAHLYQLSNGSGGLFGVAAVHPTQLYEMFGVLVGAMISYTIIHRKYQSGIAVGFFGAWFAVVRFLNMQLRTNPDSLNVHAWFYPLLYVSIFLLCCVIIYWRLNRRQFK